MKEEKKKKKGGEKKACIPEGGGGRQTKGFSKIKRGGKKQAAHIKRQ